MINQEIMPPCSVESEQCVIGGIMLDSQSDRAQKILSSLTADAFYNRQHAVIYSTMQALNNKNLNIDAMTLSDALENAGQLESVGGFAYLAELAKNTPRAANITAYAAAVRDRAIERFAIEQLKQSIEILYARNGMSAEEKIEAAQSLMMRVQEKTKSGSVRGAVSFSDALGRWTESVEARLSGDSHAVGLTSGIPALDVLLEPKRIVRGSLFVIGGRPKMGKTTLYLKLALNCALNENLPAIAFSMEMPEAQIVERAIAQASGVSPSVFYLDGYDDSKFALASARGFEVANSGNLYIDDTPGLPLSHIVAEARRIKRERGELGMILVDYLTLMKAERAERNDLAYGMITRGLKALAMELNCVVVLLTQLNRALEQRANKRPMPSDSRDTGQIEQDCDYWLGIYREGAYDENVNQQDTELLLRLNRHGQTGVVYVEQRNGAIYDVNQEQARRSYEQREESARKPYAKKSF